MQVLCDTLALAEPAGFIRLFVDEGSPMARLLSEAAARGVMPDYIGKLLAAFQGVMNDEGQTTALSSSVTRSGPSSLVKPLSQRELEVLRLIALGLANQEIGDRLFLALNTVKGHNRGHFRQATGPELARKLSLVPANWVCCRRWHLLLFPSLPRNNTQDNT